MRILFVDDSAPILEAFTDLLKMHGHEVVTAIDGSDGLYKFMESGEFDLVITDINMPIRDGIWMTEKIKKVKPDARVVVLSTPMKGQEKLVMEAGAECVYPKTGFKQLMEENCGTAS